ncbi:MAG: hypothetical protein NWE91_03345 [Candidatus Bathyarchaeota archaeon]|nr:hypothetical protein [Candidatus Bathyarchaeota archaeon]
MMLEIQELEKPFKKVSHGLIAGNIRLLETGITHPFIILNDRTKILARILSDRKPWLVKTKEALGNFSKAIYKIRGIDGLYFNIREAYDRTPSGHITDIRVIIPESNRDIEYKIYDAFGELLRRSRPLLFDLHLIKLRGRKPEEVIPKGYWHYEY